MSCALFFLLLSCPCKHILTLIFPVFVDLWLFAKIFLQCSWSKQLSLVSSLRPNLSNQSYSHHYKAFPRPVGTSSEICSPSFSYVSPVQFAPSIYPFNPTGSLQIIVIIFIFRLHLVKTRFQQQTSTRIISIFAKRSNLSFEIATLSREILNHWKLTNYDTSLLT